MKIEVLTVEIDLQETIIKEMKIMVKKVLDGEATSVKLWYVRPNDVIKAVEELGGQNLDDFDTNGWQWDYSMTFAYLDKKYGLSGDGYHQNFCIFELE